MKNRLLALEAELFGARAPGFATGLQAGGSTPVKAKVESRHGDFYRGEYTIRGIEFRVAIGFKGKPAVEKQLDELAAGIEKVNTLIASDAARIKCCIVANVNTRFTLLGGRPVLLTEIKNLDRATGVHETGHALFHYLRSLDTKNAQKDIPLQVVDVFLRLAETTAHKVKAKDSEGNAKTVEEPVGLLMVDPTAWSKRGVFEHPSDDADEFFASALEAFLTDRPGLEKAIQKAVGVDATVKDPGAQLLTLLDCVAKVKGVAARTVRTDAATALASIRRVSPLEPADLDAGFYVMVRWALYPKQTP